MRLLVRNSGYPVVICRFVLDGMNGAQTKACQVKRTSRRFTARANRPIEGASIGTFLLFGATERLIAENFPHLRPASWLAVAGTCGVGSVPGSWYPTHCRLFTNSNMSRILDLRLWGCMLLLFQHT